MKGRNGKTRGKQRGKKTKTKINIRQKLKGEKRSRLGAERKNGRKKRRQRYKTKG